MSPPHSCVGLKGNKVIETSDGTGTFCSDNFIDRVKSKGQKAHIYHDYLQHRSLKTGESDCINEFDIWIIIIFF